MAIRNIIFDLGGIFIDIHYHRTREAFHALGVADFDAYFQQSHSNPLFARLETGTITPDAFYDAFRAETALDVTNEAIAAAWNAMLGDFRPASVNLLPALREQYRIYLLSNTNQIHHDAFSAQYAALSGGASFDAHFHTAHYSHLLGLRKPDVICYQKVLELHGLEATETLFVDDTFKNIEGARMTGIQTLWLEPGSRLEDEIGKKIG
ncbi:MAG: HAD family phosphatase [Chitinophagaceae bacterium]|jgi:putative hydrolase of the HAD superfamily|nr:HAD family phosphatase [Chitinophagaceae bacterium]